MIDVTAEELFALNLPYGRAAVLIGRLYGVAPGAIALRAEADASLLGRPIQPDDDPYRLAAERSRRPGCIGFSTVNRGVLVGVYDAECGAAHGASGGRYAAVCEAHGSVHQSNDLPQLWLQALHPGAWCAMCWSDGVK